MKHKKIVAAIFALCLLALFALPERSVAWEWRERWALVAGLVLLTWLIEAWSILDYLWGYLLLSGLAFSFLPVYSGTTPSIQKALHLASAETTTLIFVLGFVLVGRQRHALSLALRYFVWALIPVALIWGTRLEVPLTHNPSITGTFIALMSIDMPWMLLIPAVLALGKLGASIPFMVLAVGLVARFPWKRSFEKMDTRGLPTMVVIWALWAGFVSGVFGWHKLHDMGGRLPVWRMVKITPDTLWFGHGPGSTQVLIPLAQAAQGQLDNLFLALHSDWLQIGFEYGLIGLGGSLWAFWEVCKRLTGAKRAQAIAFGVAMLFNWPLHFIPTALLAATLIGEAL